MLIGVAATVAAIGIGTGTAFAFWTVSGSGSGAGAGTTVQALTVVPETPSGTNATLFPGGPAGSVYFEITNSNPFPVQITAVAWSSPTSTLTSQCASSNISVDANAPTSAANGLTPFTVPASATSSLESIPGVLDLASTASTGCQGVAFDVVMNITGTQQA
jgi:hypothetical protein